MTDAAPIGNLAAARSEERSASNEQAAKLLERLAEMVREHGCDWFYVYGKANGREVYASRFIADGASVSVFDVLGQLEALKVATLADFDADFQDSVRRITWDA